MVTTVAAHCVTDLRVIGRRLRNNKRWQTPATLLACAGFVALGRWGMGVLGLA